MGEFAKRGGGVNPLIDTKSLKFKCDQFVMFFIRVSTVLAKWTRSAKYEEKIYTTALVIQI